MTQPNKLFVPGKPFQLSVMFAGKAKSLLLRYSGGPLKYSNRVGSGLPRKPYTGLGLKRPGKEKHSSLFGPFVSYEEKSFCAYGSR